MRTLICMTTLLSLLGMPHSLVQTGKQNAARATGQAASDAGYPNTTNGLRDLLNDMRAAAKDSDSARLRSLIASTEIPDYTNWFVQTFGVANGPRWASTYGKTRTRREAELQSEMMQLAQQHGYFSAKGIVPPDVDGLMRRRTPIGYFFYVHGKFCWNTR